MTANAPSTTNAVPPTIKDRSYGIILLCFLPSVPEPATAIPTTANTQILLIDQKTIDPYVTYWGLPKGHAEKGDASIKHTAIRELEEETSLKVHIEDLLIFEEGGKEVVIKETYVNPVRKREKEVRFWPALVRGQQEVRVQERELVCAEWLGWGEAIGRITFGEGREMLRDVGVRLDARARELGVGGFEEGLKAGL